MFLISQPFKKYIFNNFFRILGKIFGGEDHTAHRTANRFEGRTFRADSLKGYYGKTLKDNLPVIFKSSRNTTRVMATGNYDENET
jgi:hypothetical protein